MKLEFLSALLFSTTQAGSILDSATPSSLNYLLSTTPASYGNDDFYTSGDSESNTYYYVSEITAGSYWCA